MITGLSLNKQLAQPKTSWQLCLLAALGGVASALLVTLFTIVIKGLQYLYSHNIAHYINSEFLSRLIIPIIGVLVILLLAKVTGYKYLRTGIPFVLHRLKVAYGVIPFRNTFNQFWGSSIAIASGFSVGREGPAVHLGAACSSYIGNKLNLPFNTVRTLCACGIAAGISASFNTPIAAVIFVMEVILREYKVHIFIPIMIAAIVGSTITESIYGPAHQFEFFDKIQLSLAHYPVLILFAIILGILSFAFNKNLTALIKYSSKYSLAKRLLVAAVVTGALGAYLPTAINTELHIGILTEGSFDSAYFLIALLVAKILMTIIALGLGIPGGVVGPILVIGAISGVAASGVMSGVYASPQLAADMALMGMAGFMAATLNAPLAALLAVVELSNQIEVIAPAMVVISTACVFSGQFFKNRSVFVMQLEVQKLLYRQPPIEKSLQRIGVLGIMQNHYSILPNADERQLISHYNASDGQQLIITKTTDVKPKYIWHQARVSEDNVVSAFDQHVLIPISSRATLSEAYSVLKDLRKGGVYVYHDSPDNFIGIVSFAQIRKYLLEGKTSQ